jgi:hypothetical protein
MDQPGRPLKIKSLAVLNKKIKAYFDSCDPHWELEEDWVQAYDEDTKTYLEDKKGNPVYVKKMVKVKTKQLPYTITGLALALGIDRSTLLRYGDKELFYTSIKGAKLRCQQFTENALYAGNSTGPIFSLKNNYDWKDKSEVELSGDIKRDIKEEEVDAIIARAEARQSSKTDKA